MTNENVELREIEVPEGESFFDVGPPTPAPETPPSVVAAETPTTAPEAGQPASPPATDSQTPPPVPAWWEGVKDEDRPAVVDAVLRSLKPEDLAKVPSFRETIDRTAQDAARQGAESVQRQTLSAQETQRISQTAASLAQRVGDLLPTSSGINLVDELDGYAEAVAHGVYGLDVEPSLLGVLGRVAGITRIDQLPAAAKQAYQQAQSFEQRVQVLGYLIANTAHNAGKQAAGTGSATATKADEAVREAATRAKILAELKANGQLRDDTPPAIGQGLTGGVAGEISEDDFNRIMNNPDEYDKAMANPETASQISKLFAASFGG